ESGHPARAPYRTRPRQPAGEARPRRTRRLLLRAESTLHRRAAGLALLGDDARRARALRRDFDSAPNAYDSSDRRRWQTAARRRRLRGLRTAAANPARRFGRSAPVRMDI